MKQGSTVLLVSGGGGTNLALRKVLSEAGIEVRVVGSCEEVRDILREFEAPAVLFSETALPDGTWMDILDLATQAERRVPVVVVSRVVDINLYINALENGASDFIVPPFNQQDISHVLQCAAQAGMAGKNFRMPGVAAA